jgi:hypothetical protein
MEGGLKSKRIELSGDVETILDHFDREGWVDGLPIVPPTPERVQRFIDFAGLDAGQVIGVLEPAKGIVTVEKVALNAVMAGCRPEYMPVVLAAAEILADKRDAMRNEIYTRQTTSHSTSFLLVVNGPIRKKLGITSGESGISVSWRANATIGRAIQLLLLNVGGIPGVSRRHTWGYYVSSAYCMAENEEESPWEPFHVEHGFSPEDSTVTVLMVEPPHHMEVSWAPSMVRLLGLFARAMSTPACRDSYGGFLPTVFFGPNQASGIAEAGFSKRDVKQFLFEYARTPYKDFGEGASETWQPYHKKYFTASPDVLVPMVENSDQFNVFVVGGPGPQSLHLPHHKLPIELCIRRIGGNTHRG